MILENTAGNLRRWAVNSSLPLWAGAGFNASTGRFEERLTLDGKADLGAPIRLIVQARQIYSFSVAARRNWHPHARNLVERGFGAMLRDYRGTGGVEGWAYAIGHDGSVIDGMRDLYSHAFVLLAVASYVEATGKRDALAVADETLAFLDAQMQAEYGGFVEALPLRVVPRRQNPHMHMFEGLLSLWRVSAKVHYLDRAGEIFDLFRRRFFQPHMGILGEYYDERLNPAAGEAGRVVEAGHHYEWIWLLRWFEKACGQDVQVYVDALYRHADRNGHDASGLIVDESFDDGRVRLPSHRVWPMTEAIKANAVEAARGREGAATKTAALAGLLQDRFFSGALPGGWMDRLDADGRPATIFMPASTLYHVVCALDVVESKGAIA